MRYGAPTGRPSAELSTDCRTDTVSILSAYHLVDVDDPERQVVQDTFVAFFARGKEPGDNCEVLGTVTRKRYLSRVVMSRVARCDLVLNPYPAGGVDLRPDGTGTSYLLGGWTSSAASPGIRLREPSGALGFALSAELGAGGLAITLRGEAPSVPEVLVNNQPVAVSPIDEGWRVDVPSSTVGALGRGRLVVTLVGHDDEPLALTRVVVEPGRAS
jgi:hypothetical protein